MFISFEGGEGCGKSVQSKMLYRHLCREGYSVVLTHEPGGTPLGDSICRWLKWKEGNDIPVVTEILLFNASRSYLIDRVIKPSLKAGRIVICDRFTDSTLAYQGYGSGTDLEIIKSLNNLATDGIKPDLTILLDMPVDAGFSRKGKHALDRFEKQSLNFHQKVRHGYIDMAQQEPDRWMVVNASLTKKEVAHIIWDRVNMLLSSQGT